MTRLFDDDDRLTLMGLQVDHEITLALSPLFTKYEALGYSARDLAAIAQPIITAETSCMVLSRRQSTSIGHALPL